MKNLAQLVALLALILVGGSGCATSSKGFQHSPTAIESKPSGALVYLDGQLAGRTPCMVRMSPRKDVHIKVEREGYETAEFMSMSAVDTGGRIAMVANASGVIFPPLLVVNYGVDYLTGAYKSHPDKISVPLERCDPPARRDDHRPDDRKGRVMIEVDNGPPQPHGIPHFFICVECRTYFQLTPTVRACPTCPRKTR